jgi:glycine cleavage system transcriptional repressor
MSQLVLTAIGPDRPGLVGDFSGRLFAAGVNLADSRMVNLRGQFALILLVEGSDDALRRLQRELPPQAAQIGLAVTFTPQAPERRPLESLPFRLKTYSMDQPGIVHRVSSVLQGHGINIEELQTRLESGPFMGTPVFTMELRISVPKSVAVRQLRRELDAACDALNCDYDLEPA